MARELRSGKKQKETKVSKVIQKPKKTQPKKGKKSPEPIVKSKATRSKSTSQPQQTTKNTIRKTRSILDVQQQGISFLKNSSQTKRKSYNLSTLSKQSKTQTRSKNQIKINTTPFSIKTRQQDTEKKEEKIEIEIEEENEKKVKKTRKSQGKPVFDMQQPSFGLIDVVFCCDTTFSMDQYIKEAKKAIKSISQNIVQKVGLEGIDVKFGFVGYQDHKPQDAKYVTKVLDLDSDVKMMKLIEKEQCYGGGDDPEAVLDGLWDSINKISWRQVKNTPYLRYIFHICDAPPHGTQYTKQSETFKKGCPCKLTAEQIGKGMHEKQIHYRLIKTPDDDLEKMTKIFQKTFTNFEQCTLKDASELNVRVSDMFNNEVFPEYKK